ncbi:L-valine transporter subunit YgaH [Acinetobacter populi]|uniref:L-valine transporter subunit YgaH n=1 Tax=Acinetobacter populi TaxID=1582270 RepID=A0A1Z9YXX8_9GAMM|nr:L-valine transporter subunit YgaH [Acinetobacter populi]OUY07071.1 L-valine transporter subunit YgaH [Acinetobacter populi]
MHLEIIIIGIVVGIANFLSRFAPLWFLQRKHRKQTQKGHAWIGVAMGSIGISAICAMLMVATLPPLLENPAKTLAMVCGFSILVLVYFLTKKIVLATLLAALCYGLVFTYLPV